MKLLTIIIPLYNEKNTILKIIDKVKRLNIEIKRLNNLEDEIVPIDTIKIANNNSE